MIETWLSVSVYTMHVFIFNKILYRACLARRIDRVGGHARNRISHPGIRSLRLQSYASNPSNLLDPQMRPSFAPAETAAPVVATGSAGHSTTGAVAAEAGSVGPLVAGTTSIRPEQFAVTMRQANPRAVDAAEVVVVVALMTTARKIRDPRGPRDPQTAAAPVEVEVVMAVECGRTPWDLALARPRMSCRPARGMGPGKARRTGQEADQQMRIGTMGRRTRMLEQRRSAGTSPLALTGALRRLQTRRMR